MPFRKHVDRELPAYCEGALSEIESERVRKHLEQCGRCRRRAEETAAGVSLAGLLSPVSLPSDRAEAIRRSLVEGSGARGEAGREPAFSLAWRLAALAATVAATLGVIWYWRARGPDVQVEEASAPAAEFEELARALHSGLVSGNARLQIETDSVPQVRSWLRERTGLSASLAANRPAAERERYLLRGAAAVPANGFTAAAISYSVDSRPVTLLTARAKEVPASPHWGLFGKKVRYRLDPRTGTKVLTWTNSGQAYALVSDLPQLGQQACLVCHTDSARRRAIETLGNAFSR